MAPDKDPRSPARLFPALREGDKVALFSPSSHMGDAAEENMARAVRQLEGWGLRVRTPPVRRHLYLAGADRERAEEFENLYCDSEIKALFATRGGYGATRMLPLLNPAALRAAAPKPVVGFSDLSALFAFMEKEADFVTLHAPCLAAPGHLSSPSRLANEGALWEALFQRPWQGRHALSWLTAPRSEQLPLRGRLAGGCLSLLASLIGTPWQVSNPGGILVLEEVDEAPYEIDRMLTQLKQTGGFKGLAALVLGDWTGCDGGEPGLLTEMFSDVLGGLELPVLQGLQVGHGPVNLPLPLGSTAEITVDSPGGEPVLQVSLH